MPAKDVRFHEPARHKLLAGVNILADAVKGDPRPQGPQRRVGALFRCADRDQGRRFGRQGNRAERTSSRTWAHRW